MERGLECSLRATPATLCRREVKTVRHIFQKMTKFRKSCVGSVRLTNSTFLSSITPLNCYIWQKYKRQTTTSAKMTFGAGSRQSMTKVLSICSLIYFSSIQDSGRPRQIASNAIFLPPYARILRRRNLRPFRNRFKLYINKKISTTRKIAIMGCRVKI